LKSQSQVRTTVSTRRKKVDLRIFADVRYLTQKEGKKFLDTYPLSLRNRTKKTQKEKEEERERGRRRASRKFRPELHPFYSLSSQSDDNYQTKL